MQHRGETIMTTKEECVFTFETIPDGQMESIVSYLSTANDLCALDATNKRLASFTEPVWQGLAVERFGMGRPPPHQKRCCSGKDAWRKGKSLTSPERKLHCVFQIQPVGVELNDIIQLACHGRTIVAADYDNKSIVLRDAESLQQRAILEQHGTPGIFSAVGGSADRPVVALAQGLGTEFSVYQESQDSFRQTYDLAESFPQDKERFGDGGDFVYSPILGCQNHFVMYCLGKLYLFQFDSSKPLSEKHGVLPVQSFEVEPRANWEHHYLGYSMKWASSDDLLSGTFVVACHGKISIWHLDDSTSKMTQLQAVNTGTGKAYEYEDVAVGGRYLVANPVDSDMLHLYDRCAGCKIAELGNESDRDYREGCYHPLQMHVFGDLLVCQRDRLSHTFCVWQLRTQSLLATFDAPFPPGDRNITSVIPIQGDGYVCFVSHSYDDPVETVFGFPESETGFMKLREISKKHTLLVEPTVLSRRTRNSHRQDLKLFIRGVKRDWHQENNASSQGQFKKYCTALLEEILDERE